MQNRVDMLLAAFPEFIFYTLQMWLFAGSHTHTHTHIYIYIYIYIYINTHPLHCLFFLLITSRVLLQPGPPCISESVLALHVRYETSFSGDILHLPHKQGYIRAQARSLFHPFTFFICIEISSRTASHSFLSYCQARSPS